MGEFKDGFEVGLILGGICGFVVAALPVFYVIVTTPWLKCYLSGAGIPGLHILGMRLRGTPVGVITDAYITLIQSGVNIDVRHVERAYLSQPNRVRTTAELVHHVKWGLEEANPKPAWAIDVPAMTMQRAAKSEPQSAKT